MSTSRVCVLCRREPAQAPWVPFCSERCKLQDLAAWVDGRYRVAAEPVSKETDLEDESLDGRLPTDD